MALFKLVKTTGTRAFYRTEGSTRNVKMDTRMFVGETAPAELEIGGAEFVVNATAGGGREVPPEIAAAQAQVKAFREQQKAEKEARMTPEQRARRDARRAERKAEREAARAKKAPRKAKK